MRPGFYTFANFFLGLAVAMSVFNSTIHFLIGDNLFILNSFKYWYLIENVVSLTGTLFLLRYYYYKKYRTVFWTAIIAGLTTLCCSTLIYSLLLLYRQLQSFYGPMLLITIVAGIVNSGFLIFSDSGKSVWLKWAGILSGFAAVIVLTINIYLFSDPGNLLTESLKKINNSALWIGSLVPVLFILNFRNESKFSNTKEVSRRDLYLENWLGLACISCLGFALFFGANVASQSYDVTHVSKEAKALAMPFESKYYASNDGDTLMYRLMKPLNYDPKKDYPMVVCLPYACAEDNVRQIWGCPPAQWLSQEENRKKYPAFLFVPRCPKGTGWGAVANTPSIEKLALEAIASLVKEPQIDEKRVYVTGISRGGYGSWHFIGTHPELFAAAVPICGGDEPVLGKKMVDVAVWAFHGAKDRNVPVTGSRDLIASIRNSGGNPRYTEFPDLEHDIWEKVKATPGLLDWLFNQKQK